MLGVNGVYVMNVQMQENRNRKGQRGRRMKDAIKGEGERGEVEERETGEGEK